MWAGMIAHNGTCGVGCEEDWASHFLEHEISAIYGVTHGAGLSVIFPAWMTWMVEHNVGKIAQYAVRVGAFLNQKIRSGCFGGYW